MQYLLDRLKEPGTIRSLAVVLFAIRLWLPDSIASQIVDVSTAQSFLEGLIALLGLYSALMPAQKVEVEAVKAAVTTPEVAGTIADKVVEALPSAAANTVASVLRK